MVKVLNPGFYSSIQDMGRIGYQNYGVPCSGVMDTYSALLANMLIGNNQDAPVLEMTMTGASLQFYTDTYIVICGANMSPRLNESPVLNNTVIKVNVGDIISFGKLKAGFRCYLSVLKGFKSDSVLGSCSMYSGISKQAVLLKHDELQIESSSVLFDNKHAAIKVKENHLTSRIIEVFKGPEFDLLSKTQQGLLFSKVFSISKDNNRMAYQLNECMDNTLPSIITSGVLPGTIQLTPSGRLIILMRDCQTTGGYPRVLQLKESSINVLSQKFTNDSIKFVLNTY
ncbi:biotin-dependent carboxyltransferase family protein [uncultured Algibacter sp.]|uniref:5-oxoprolinase subunit C family protein n=1 Tax=uncultured Algibacter sp. TaxID=298659 RepID=UPI0032174E1B